MTLKLSFSLKLSLLILLNLVLFYLNNNSIETEELYVSSLSDKLSPEQINLMISDKENKFLLFWLFDSIALILLISFTSIAILAGLRLVEIEISLKTIFKICVESWFIFLLMGFLKFYWLYFISPPQSLKFYQDFIPLSVLNLFNYDSLNQIEVILYESMNIFDVAFVYYIILQFKNHINYQQIRKTLILTYITGIILIVGIKILIFG